VSGPVAVQAFEELKIADTCFCVPLFGCVLPRYRSFGDRLRADLGIFPFFEQKGNERVKGNVNVGRPVIR
jgi:hypothetical protein